MEDANAAEGRAHMIEQTYRSVRRHLAPNTVFVKFVISGVLGYVLYQVTIFAAYDLLSISLFVSSLIAAEVSIVGGFVIRDIWVFTDGPVVQRSLSMRFWQYQAKSLVSTLIIVTTTVNVLTSGFEVPHFISVPIGVALGFGWNWGWERGVIWRKQSGGSPAEK